MKTTKPVKPSKDKAKQATLKKDRRETRQIDALMKLMTHETGKSIQFEIAAEKECKVYIAGTFNNWDPTTHPLDHHPEDGVFRATLHLPVGTHEYKFVVNGVWHMDAKCPHWSMNEHGTLNSVIHV